MNPDNPSEIIGPPRPSEAATGPGPAPAAKPWWRSPWQYRESLAFVGGLGVVGLGLEWFSPVDMHLWNSPLSLTFGALLVIFIAFTGGLGSATRPVIWLSSAPLSVSLIGAMLFLGLIMGLTPQLAVPKADPDWFDRLGLTRVTSSWPYIIIHLATLVTLGLAIVRQVKRPGGIRKAAFIINHSGVWLLLLAAGLGAADRRSYTMWIEEGQVEWRGRLTSGLVVELPLAVRLIDFDLEEYPPKVTVIDRTTGRPQPENKPDWHQIEPDRPAEVLLNGWRVTVDAYIHRAIRGAGGSYSESPRLEAAPAALITAHNPATGATVRGWITDGGPIQPFQVLELDEHMVVAMARPEPRGFSSEITVFTKKGQHRQALIEVNKPLYLWPWMIYQHSYDQGAGRMSTHSGLEVVYDPWWPVVLTALIIMILGALLLIWRGRERG